MQSRAGRSALAALALATFGVAARGNSFTAFPNNSTHLQSAVLGAIANVPAGAGTVFDPTGHTNDIQVVNFSTLIYTGALDVTSTLNRIRQNDSMVGSESDDGGFFNFNNTGELPNVPRMGQNYYMEFMVWPNIDLVAGIYDITAHPYDPGDSYPGPQRILVGSGGEVYYTGDHYTTNDYVNPTSSPAAITVDTWSATNASWNAGGNWSTGSVPGNGIAAYLSVNDTATRTVTYAQSGSITLGDLLVNADGTTTAHGSMTFTIGQNALTTQKEEIWARYSTAAVNQTGGTHTVIGALRIAGFTGSNGSYTLSGGTLSAGSEYIGSTDLTAAAGNGTFTQAGGTHTVTGALSLGFAAGGTGTYSLQNGKLSTGSMNINSGGLVNFNGGSLLAGNLSLSGTGQLLMSRGGNKALVLTSLAIASTSKLDLSDNAIIVNYGTETTGATRNTIRNLLINGRNAGPASPAPWNGAGGITSSYAHSNGNGFNLAIGYADNAALASINAAGSYTTFAGQAVGSNTILVQMTRGADCNLDGVVDGSDVSIIGTHFNQPGSGQWYFGDFDYSGLCDGNDISVLGTTFGQTSPVLSPAQLSAEFGGAFAAAFASSATLPVPEPGSLMLLTLGGIGMLRRRRPAKSS